MASTPEGRVKEKVKRLLKQYDPALYVFMPRGTTFGVAGVPDFIGCFEGRFFGIETKAGKNKPTPMQELQMDRIQQAGGKSFVVNEDPETLQAVKDWLDLLIMGALVQRGRL